MKYLITIVLLLSVGSILYGFSILEEQTPLGHKFIGSGTVGIFLVAMPLFLIMASKGKKMKDYMLTNEKIREMQEKETRNTDNQ